MIRVLLDQGLPRSAAFLLRESGWDAVHVGDLGLSRAADKDILCRAGTDYRVVITLDADFHALLALGEQTGPSTVRIRIEGLHGKAVADLLVAIWPTIEIPVREGALITVTENAVRIRRLPIASRR